MNNLNHATPARTIMMGFGFGAGYGLALFAHAIDTFAGIVLGAACTICAIMIEVGVSRQETEMESRRKKQ